MKGKEFKKRRNRTAEQNGIEQNWTLYKSEYPFNLHEVCCYFVLMINYTFGEYLFSVRSMANIFLIKNRCHLKTI